MLELYVFPLNRVNDPLQPDLPGLVAMPPIKQGGRGREADLLILYISLSRPDAYNSMVLKQMLQNGVDTYRKGHGTVTAGLRMIAEQLNSILLENNLRSAQKGEPALATLNLLALRENVLYLAQCGATHTFVINGETVSDYNELLTGGRGLGFASSLNMKYYQVNAEPGEVVVLSPNPPEAWTVESLTGSQQLTLEHLRRRLLNQTGPELQAVVVKFQLGNGQIHLLRPRASQAGQSPVPAVQPAPEETSPTPPAPAVAQPAAEPAPLPAELTPLPTAAPQADTQPAAAPMVDATVPISTPAGGPETPAQREIPAGQPLTRADRVRLEWARSGRATAALPPATTAEALAAESAPAPALPLRRRGQNRRRMASGWLGIKSFFRRIGYGARSLSNRVSPAVAEKKPGLPAAVMLFIAIAVPLVVVAVAATVYLEIGKAEQRQAYYLKALEFTAAALQQPDPASQNNDWIQAQTWLDKAEEIGVTDDTRALRQRIQEAFDTSEGIIRLDFKPISPYGFSAGTKIARIVANSSDIYLLDSAQGKVVRLFATASGFEIDGQFRCSPGQYGSLQVGPLIDLVILPPNVNKSTVMAMDANASMLYCGPGNPPAAVQLQAPDNGWGKVTAMALYQESLVVLDQKDNAVWAYGGKDSTFADPPRLFFDKVIPQLGNVIDLAYYGDELYLLRVDGSMIQCTYSNPDIAPTRCKDPAYYGDGRAGHDPAPTNYAEAGFTHLNATPPPDPSLYLLDSKGQGVYHFSLQLNFQRQLRPSYGGATHPPREAPSAFAVTPTKAIVMAYGNLVFFAQLP